jgi:hypothetical protein
MRPHAKYANRPLFHKYFVHDSVLNIYAPGISAGEISDELLVRWRILKWITTQHIQDPLSSGPQTACGKFLGVFECLLGENKLPTHHLSFFALFASGSAIPALMDSRIPGTERRYKVSCIASQSSAETSTALLRLPEIVTGLWDSDVSSIKRYKFARASLAESVTMVYSYD